MRHGKKFNHLGRTSEHRKALLANQAISLIEHKRIFTTLAKAKALKKYVEPLITKAKNDTTHSRRVVFSYLQNKAAIKELFKEVVEKVADRPGGYTRILKIDNRSGDNAEMCLIELVDYNDLMLGNAASTAKKKRVRRGGGKQIASDQGAADVTKTSESEATDIEEDVKEETKKEAKGEEKGERKEKALKEAKVEVKEEPKEEAPKEAKAEVKEEPKEEAPKEAKAEAKDEPKDQKKDPESGADEKKDDKEEK
ncbi:MAG: 50S ribosomal protein L17 [Bacteroidetes bacterium]|nr:50S ribosomal protein L17 [Bacteroidota bacterium]